MSIKLRLLLFGISLKLKFRLALIKLGFGVHTQALKLHSCLWWKLKHQLRLLDDSSHSEGFDPTFDKIVHLAALRLAMPHILDENVYQLRAGWWASAGLPAVAGIDEDARKHLRLEYEENKEAVDQLLSDHGGAAAITTTLTSYFQVESFLQNYLGNEKGQEYYISSARSYDPKVLRLDVKTVRALLRKTRREIKSLTASISDREAFKISLPTQNLTALLSWVSALFLASGYLYCRAFLGHFGVEVDKYFSLSDYVAASIEGIRLSVVATVSGCLGGFFARHSISRMSYAQASESAIHRRIQFILYAALIWGVTATAYFRDLEAFYSLAAVSILSLLFWPVGWLVHHYFDRQGLAPRIFLDPISLNILASLVRLRRNRHPPH